MEAADGAASAARRHPTCRSPPTSPALSGSSPSRCSCVGAAVGVVALFGSRIRTIRPGIAIGGGIAVVFIVGGGDRVGGPWPTMTWTACVQRPQRAVRSPLRRCCLRRDAQLDVEPGCGHDLARARRQHSLAARRRCSSTADRQPLLDARRVTGGAQCAARNQRCRSGAHPAGVGRPDLPDAGRPPQWPRGNVPVSHQLRLRSHDIRGCDDRGARLPRRQPRRGRDADHPGCDLDRTTPPR